MHLVGDALLECGAAILATSPSARLWAFAVCGTPLQGETAASLIEAGADPCALLPENEYIAVATASLRACVGSRSPSNSIPMILNRYAALHGAVLNHDDDDLLSLLARAAIDVDVRGDYDGWTALHVAIHAQRFSAVRVLLAAGAHPRALRWFESKAGEGPLQIALALPDSAAKRSIVAALRSALKRSPDPAPPFNADTLAGMLPDTVLQELAMAARVNTEILVEPTKSGKYLGQKLRVGKTFGCRACGKHSLDGDDPHGIRGAVKMAALKMCSSCHGAGFAFYCSRGCQRADWPRHKAECKPQTKVRAPFRDLGYAPSQDIIAAAVAEYGARRSNGFRGNDNPVPSYVTASGERIYCLYTVTAAVEYLFDNVIEA